MTKRAAAPVHPVWIRWVAALCLLLAGVVGTAQAVHTHGKFVSHASTELHQPALDGQTLGEEHCPLCVALHTSFGLPMVQVVSYTLARTYVVPVPEQAVERPETLWHFARFGRPPPVRG